jgi:hypothetical protein
VQLGRIRSRPRRTVRARPTASADAACAARMRGAGSPARPAHAMRSGTAQRRCSVSQRRLGTGARETAGKRRLTGAETAVRRDGDGERCEMASARATAARAARRLLEGGWHRRGGTDGERRARGAVGAWREVRGSGCWDTRRCPDSALSHAVGVARAAAWARHAMADKRGPLSAIFKLKIYPEGN